MFLILNDIDFDSYPDNDTLKMHVTTLTQNKNYSNSYKSYQIIDWSSFQWCFFLILTLTLQQEVNFSWPRIKVNEPEKKRKLNTTKQNYFDLHQYCTIVIFE